MPIIGKKIACLIWTSKCGRSGTVVNDVERVDAYLSARWCGLLKVNSINLKFDFELWLFFFAEEISLRLGGVTPWSALWVVYSGHQAVKDPCQFPCIEMMTVVIEMTMKFLMISSGTIFLMLVWQPHMNVIDGKGVHVRLVSMSEGRTYQSTFHLTVTTLDREDSRLDSVCTLEVFNGYSKFS